MLALRPDKFFFSLLQISLRTLQSGKCKISLLKCCFILSLDFLSLLFKLFGFIIKFVNHITTREDTCALWLRTACHWAAGVNNLTVNGNNLKSVWISFWNTYSRVHILNYNNSAQKVRDNIFILVFTINKVACNCNKTQVIVKISFIKASRLDCRNGKKRCPADTVIFKIINCTLSICFIADNYILHCRTECNLNCHAVFIINGYELRKRSVNTWKCLILCLTHNRLNSTRKTFHIFFKV